MTITRIVDHRNDAAPPPTRQRYTRTGSRLPVALLPGTRTPTFWTDGDVDVAVISDQIRQPRRKPSPPRRRRRPVRCNTRVPFIVVPAARMVSAEAYAFVAFTGQGGSATTLLFAFVLLGKGVGLTETISNDLISLDCAGRQTGAASAVSETAYKVGFAPGTAVPGSVVLASYDKHPAGARSMVHPNCPLRLAGSTSAILGPCRRMRSGAPRRFPCDL